MAMKEQCFRTAITKFKNSFNLGSHNVRSTFPHLITFLCTGSIFPREHVILPHKYSPFTGIREMRRSI